MKRPRRTSLLRVASIATLLLLAMPAVVAAHSELETSTPANGSTVDGPFGGPIVLTFSADLADGSKADLLDAAGATLASASVDGPGAKMTINLADPLAAGEYDVKWVSIADDGDLLRGTVSFTVTPPPPTPSPTPTPAPSATPTEAPPSAPASPSPSSVPTASPTPSPAGTVGGGDVILPIVVALVVVAVGGSYLLTRRRPPTQA